VTFLQDSRASIPSNRSLGPRIGKEKCAHLQPPLIGRCKALNRGALDEELTARDKERVAAFLQTYGDLTPDLVFKGSTRSGYDSLPDAGDRAGERRDPVALRTLLDLDLWSAVLFEEVFDFQATMFQPVGRLAAWTAFRPRWPRSPARWYA
jgi:monoamine oxidase